MKISTARCTPGGTERKPGLLHLKLPDQRNEHAKTLKHDHDKKTKNQDEPIHSSKKEESQNFARGNDRG